MADIVFLASYPSFTDYGKDFKCNEGRYVWHLWASVHGARDMKVEFLYDDYRTCKMRRHRLIDIISRNKPKVIVAFGQDVIDVLDINEKVGKCRGSVYKKQYGKHSLFIVPTYDFRGLKKPDRMFAEESIEKGVYLAHDLSKAMRVYKNGWVFPAENFILEPTVEQVEKFTEDAIKNDWLLGCDLEGTGLDVQIVDVVMHGFAWSENDAIVIPELKEGRHDYWSRKDWPRVQRCLNKIYSNCRLMFQNGVGYDVPLLRNRGWNLPLEQFQEDTMILHHSLHPESPHNIGFISSIYGKQHYWKSAVLDWKVSIFKKDQTEVKRYNARDCVALHQIRNGMIEEIKDTIRDYPEFQNFWAIYHKSMREARALITMSNNGIQLNKKKLGEWNKRLEKDIIELDEDLRKVCELPDSFSFTSGDHKALWVYGIPIKKYKLENIKKELDTYNMQVFNYQYECPKCGRKKVKKFYPEIEEAPRNIDMKCSGKGACNSSRIHIRTEKEPTLLKGKSKDTNKYRELVAAYEVASVKRLPKLRNFKPKLSDKTGKPDLDKKALTKYSIAINNRLEDIDNLKRRRAEHDQEEKDLKFLREVLGKLQKFNKLEKLRSSFTSYKTDANGRVHPHFLITGTATGRLSCIAKGTKIQTVRNFEDSPEGIEIQDVKVGDYVYCSNKDGVLKTRKVLKVMNNGVRNTIGLNWRSFGSGKTGKLVLTPEHKVKLYNGEWIRADEVVPTSLGELGRLMQKGGSIDDRSRLLALHFQNGRGDYSYIYSKGYRKVKNARFLLDCHKGDGLHTHHIDGNKKNDTFENLTTLTSQEHGREHCSATLTADNKMKGTLRRLELIKEGKIEFKSGYDNKLTERFSKEYCLRLIKEHGIFKRDLVKVHDFNTLKREFLFNGLDWRNLWAYTIDRKDFVEQLHNTQSVKETGKLFGISEMKAERYLSIETVEDKEWMGIYFNHVITDVTLEDPMEVYDLEIECFEGEDTHNFFANELCVHNCKAPNLQQIPSGEVGKQIRGCFQAGKGRTLISIDYENLEVWIGAYLMNDKALQEILEAGVNFHDFNNGVFFGVTKDDPEWGTLRKAAKIIVFGRILYGGSDNGIFNNVITAYPDCGLTLKKFKKAVKNYMDAHPDYVQWCKDVQAIALNKRFSVNGFGRVRQLMGDDSKIMRQALNSPVQGTAADVAREAMADCQEYIDEKAKTNPRWRTVQMLLQIHDELVFECDDDMKQEVCTAMVNIMCKPITINGYTFKLKGDSEVGKYWGNQDGYDYINDIVKKEGSKH